MSIDIAIYTSGKNGKNVRGDWVLGNALESAFNNKGIGAKNIGPANWYFHESSPLVLSLNPKVRPSLVRGRPKTYAWIRGGVKDWETTIRSYDTVLASTEYLSKIIQTKFGIQAHVIRPAYDDSIFVESKTRFKDRRQITVFFNDFEGTRFSDTFVSEINKLEEVQVFGLQGIYTGLKNKNGPISPQDLSEALSRSRIVIDLTSHENKGAGVPNLRCFEAFSQGCLVVTDSHDEIRQLGFTSPVFWDGLSPFPHKSVKSAEENRMEERLLKDSQLAKSRYSMSVRISEIIEVLASDF